MERMDRGEMVGDSIELASYVLEVEPEGELPKPCFLGRALHAWVIDLVSGLSSEKGREIHDDRGLKSFTAGFLRDKGENFIRLTAIESGLVGILDEALKGEEGASICWDGILFRVKSVFYEGHPWAARTTYRALAFPWLENPSGRLSRSIILKFLSPTNFRCGSFSIPLPLPKLIFGNLLERWNRWAPIVLSNVNTEKVLVKSYRLRTLAIPLAGGGHIGFIGEVEFFLPEANPYLFSIFHLLSDFAFFSGVGAKTAMGFGICIKK